MSDFQKLPNSGSLFTNDRKRSPSSPDLTGTALINGVEMFVNGWWKVSRRGERYLSLSFKTIEDQTPPEADYGTESQDVPL